jgi:hypothetical protein
MTKRSSFVIPPDLAGAAVIVDILNRSPKLIDAKLAPMRRSFAGRCTELQIQGNIAVKAPPIRLLALCTAVHEGFTGGNRVRPRLAASHNPGRLTALPRSGMEPLPRPAGQRTIVLGQPNSQAITIWSRVRRNQTARE